MTPSRLTRGVTVDVCVAGLVLAVGALWLGGASAALGVLTGGALALANFRWVTARAARVMTGRITRGGVWYVGAAFRLTAFAIVCGALLGTGAAHPLALVVGLTTLPCALVARGLAAAGEEG